MIPTPCLNYQFNCSNTAQNEKYENHVNSCPTCKRIQGKPNYSKQETLFTTGSWGVSHTTRTPGANTRLGIFK